MAMESDDSVERIIELLKGMAKEGVFIILCKCMVCGKYYDVKNGGRTFGISHGLCSNACADKCREGR